MKKYKLICKKGEGTFSEVVCGENIENGKQYAIKCMKSSFGSLDEVSSPTDSFWFDFWKWREAHRIEAIICLHMFVTIYFF